MLTHVGDKENADLTAGVLGWAALRWDFYENNHLKRACPASVGPVLVAAHHFSICSGSVLISSASLQWHQGFSGPE